MEEINELEKNHFMVLMHIVKTEEDLEISKKAKEEREKLKGMNPACTGKNDPCLLGQE